MDWLNLALLVSVLGFLAWDHRLNAKMIKLEKRIVAMLEKIKRDETSADWWKNEK